MRIKDGVEVEFAIKVVATSSDTLPLGPQANQPSQVSGLLWKDRRVETDLTLESRLFQRAGIMAEEGLLLDSYIQSSLTDGIRSLPA